MSAHLGFGHGCLCIGEGKSETTDADFVLQHQVTVLRWSNLTIHQPERKDTKTIVTASCIAASLMVTA